jgi:hypothetical protein
MKRFLVTGCPRSGTQYSSVLFSALGARCDHEQVFGIEQALGLKQVEWNGYDGDASFLAVPFLPLDGVVVLHQTRHPLEFIRSVVGIRFLSDHRAEKPFPSVIGRNAPEVYEPEHEAERAALLWRIWNRRAESHAAITYRLEDLDVGLVLRLAQLLELELSEDQVARALDSIPRNVNARHRVNVPWENVASILGDLPAHYGY